MADLSVSELISLAEAVGIISTLFVIFYFSRKGVKAVSVDIETKVLNDLDEKIHGMAEMLVERPELVKVLNKSQSSLSPDLVFAYYILYACAHAFHMRQRKVLSDNEWAGWLRWMKSAFDGGTVGEYWVKSIQPEKWFDPAFQDFIDNEIIKVNKV
ncbi:MAG: hypothetical protein E6K91_03665 [Thaumarchaeota archaeon]|nr:MAG: hypothetical protein E6K91_03665 [Nitrososphaerota archaeon]